MAFMLFKKEFRENQMYYINFQRSFKLAGYNLIYYSWDKKGKPTNQGWSVSANDLLTLHDSAMNSEDFSLVIDFHPSATYRIGLIEIKKIHLFTYGSEQTAYWSPMMLELQDVFYEEDYENLSPEDKQRIIAEFPVSSDKKRFVEFLYLNGNADGWNWGLSGKTNAAFIYDDARQYFQQFFGK